MTGVLPSVLVPFLQGALAREFELGHQKQALRHENWTIVIELCVRTAGQDKLAHCHL